ncbi:MAG TPA: hypothetical protein PK331_03520 [Gordonia sp. (in: high G+C Gram-positive bacteria)]|uniref:hypothetical protein n=1 Tax=unclassified Gordonia (in: high G+C Gram-positive bacteria) TaxID=2657482 RepID=UPI000FA62F6B|nr:MULTISPECIES: hypothetical protein [unclassified Gordonia (in: high G+C Gram-positive bacteria)]RUP36204.1 MAG: hypothetical protein EKK60_15610 [Gordonia sp. (in: high G+C Gram-positive bacteria)]HNP58377.1 hypothetical protein [Gordonia sp. (in: high G+C Gram-positive bacteria)]HRC49981.1 hypothetical protein [Gordonia sp. (in: high G+C Gram-positive bacteria)]
MRTTGVDLDDPSSLIDADVDGLLHAAARAGAQVRAVAEAVREGAIEALATLRPRSVVIVTGGSVAAAQSARFVIAHAAARLDVPLVAAPSLPGWIGPLDVVVIVGDDAGDMALADAASRAHRRHAEFVVVAPIEGPLAGAVAGRGLDLSPRVVVPEQFRFVGHVAALIAVCQGLAQVRYLGGDLDLAALADALDAEASRNHPSHDAYGAPAKTLAERFRACAPVFCGDSPAGDALAQRAAGTLFAIGGVCGSAVDLSAAMTRMLRDVGSTPVDSIFHDPEIDGPVPSRARLFVLSTPGQQWLARRRVAALPDAETLVGSAPDSPDASADPGAPPSGDEGPDALVSQLVLAARLEMAAVYADLLGAG